MRSYWTISQENKWIFCIYLGHHIFLTVMFLIFISHDFFKGSLFVIWKQNPCTLLKTNKGWYRNIINDESSLHVHVYKIYLFQSVLFKNNILASIFFTQIVNYISYMLIINAIRLFINQEISYVPLEAEILWPTSWDHPIGCNNGDRWWHQNVSLSYWNQIIL